MRPIVPFMLLAACSGAEVARRDVMLAVESSDGGFDYTLGTGIGEFSGSDAFDRMTQARLGVRWAWATAGSPLAPVFGADLEYLDAPMGTGGMDGYGLSLTAGATWAISEWLAVDAEGFAGLQQVGLELPGQGGSTVLQADGLLQRTGIRARLLWHLSRHWSLGAEGGWASWGGDLSGSDGRDLRLDGSGLGSGIILAWRPSARPGGIE
jgi:hypothetical protein